MIDELKELRKRCLRISSVGRDGNLQSVFSSMEIIWTLYNRVMNWSKEIARSPERDYFILSKGQSTMALTAVLAQKGLFPTEELMTFGQLKSRFSMQADRTKLPEGGIENSAGSLGHGFPMATGMALAHKIRGMDNRFYVLAGDGEMNEGTMWEAALLASSKKLDNLCLIVDDNDSIGRMIDMGSLADKLRAFGFAVDACDGHDVYALTDKIQLLKEISEREKVPSCLIAKTQRGYGSRTLMTDRSWFHRYPKDDELEILSAEVDAF